MAKVAKDEIRKTAFIREYRALCEKHRMMAVMAEAAVGDEGEEWRIGVEGGHYLAFCVGDISKFPEHLSAVVEEMLIEDLMETKPE